MEWEQFTWPVAEAVGCGRSKLETHLSRSVSALTRCARAEFSDPVPERGSTNHRAGQPPPRVRSRVDPQDSIGGARGLHAAEAREKTGSRAKSCMSSRAGLACWTEPCCQRPPASDEFLANRTIPAPARIPAAAFAPDPEPAQSRPGTIRINSYGGKGSTWAAARPATNSKPSGRVAPASERTP